MSTGTRTSAGSERDAVVRARAYLLRVAEPPAPALQSFVEQHGPRRAAELVRGGEVPGPVDQETSARRELKLEDTDLELADAAGARLLVPEDPQWPSWRLLSLSLAARRGVAYAGEPIALWVRGAGPDCLGERSVAMVGSRAATGYGEHVAADLAAGLAAEGVAVVSGAAYGIDGAAHRGALAAGGCTVAVLACGVDVPYPAGHSALLAEICERGCAVSEYPPGSPPARHRFLVRNRLIAALADGTVVVEAGRRSGARNTAASTRALGRELMVVPGPVTSAMSVGCHELLRTGDGVVVSSVAEVIESVGRLGVDPEALGGQARAIDGLDLPSRRVLEALGARRGASAEEVAVESGVAVSAVRAVLPALELSGLARLTETGWCRAVSLDVAAGPG